MIKYALLIGLASINGLILLLCLSLVVNEIVNRVIIKSLVFFFEKLSFSWKVWWVVVFVGEVASKFLQGSCWRFLGSMMGFQNWTLSDPISLASLNTHGILAWLFLNAKVLSYFLQTRYDSLNGIPLFRNLLLWDLSPQLYWNNIHRRLWFRGWYLLRSFSLLSSCFPNILYGSVQTLRCTQFWALGALSVL